MFAFWFPFSHLKPSSNVCIYIVLTISGPRTIMMSSIFKAVISFLFLLSPTLLSHNHDFHCKQKIKKDSVSYMQLHYCLLHFDKRWKRYVVITEIYTRRHSTFSSCLISASNWKCRKRPSLYIHTNTYKRTQVWLYETKIDCSMEHIIID